MTRDVKRSEREEARDVIFVFDGLLGDGGGDVRAYVKMRLRTSNGRLRRGESETAIENRYTCSVLVAIMYVKKSKENLTLCNAV